MGARERGRRWTLLPLVGPLRAGCQGATSLDGPQILLTNSSVEVPVEGRLLRGMVAGAQVVA